jgi:hypothetical protein
MFDEEGFYTQEFLEVEKQIACVIAKTEKE